MGSTSRKRYRRTLAPRARAPVQARARGPLPAPTGPQQSTGDTLTVRRASRDRLGLLLCLPDDRRADFGRLIEDPANPRLLSARFAGYLDQMRTAAAREQRGTTRQPQFGGVPPRRLQRLRQRLLIEEQQLGLAVEHAGFGRLSLAETGVLLGCSKSTVCRRLARGLDLLESWVSEHDGDDDDAVRGSGRQVG